MVRRAHLRTTFSSESAGEDNPLIPQIVFPAPLSQFLLKEFVMELVKLGAVCDLTEALGPMLDLDGQGKWEYWW